MGDNYRVIEKKEDFSFLGYTRQEGGIWTIVGMSNSEVDKLLTEFKTKGTVTLGLEHLMSEETIPAYAAAKLSANKLYMKVDKLEVNEAAQETAVDVIDKVEGPLEIDVYELAAALEPMTADVYMLKVGKLSAIQLLAFKNAWEKLQGRMSSQKTVIVVPEHFEMQALSGRTFDYSVALKLMRKGHRVRRQSWSKDSCIYMDYIDGVKVIMHSGGKEWQATSKATVAENWELIA